MTVDAADSGPRPPDTAGSELVPGWLVRLAAIGWRVLVTVALVVLGVLVAIQLAIVTGAILVALIVTAVVYPLVDQLRTQRAWPRARAAGAVSVLALLVVVLTITLIGLALVPYLVEIVRLVSQGINQVTEQLSQLGLPEPVLVALNRLVSDLQGFLLSTLSQVATPIANFVTILILGGFLTFYLLDDGDRAWASATGNLDDWRVEQLTRRGEIALEEVGGYLRGTAVMAATDALTDWVYLTLLGVPLAGPLAVLVFIGGFIPYLGGLVTGTVLLVVTFAAQGFVPAVILLGLILLTNVAQERFLAPAAYGASSRVPAALAIVALPAGYAILGPLGLFATLPIVALITAFAPAIVQSLGTARALPTTSRLVPLWLDRLGQVSWRALVVIGLVWLLLQVTVVPFFSAPIVVALITAPALSPVLDALIRRGLSRTGAALAVTAGTVIVISVVFALTVVSLASSMTEILATANVGANNLQIGSAPAEIVSTFGGGVASTVASLIAGIAATAVGLAIAILLVFFFLRDGPTWWHAIVERIPGKRGPQVDQVGTSSVGILRGTMTGTAIVSFAGAVLQFITMTILGLPLAFPISVLMFFLGFIPYIGGFIATALGFLVAVAVGSQLDVILMFIFTIVFNIVQGNIVQPLVFGRTVNVHPAVVLLAAPAGFAIAGVLGMVIVTPIYSIISHNWRTVLHMFDPEDSVPEAAGARPSTPAAPAAVPPVVGREGPAISGAEP